MPRVQWPPLHHRPIIQVVLTGAAGGQPLVRHLVADTGAGTAQAGFELLLEEKDCLLCGGNAAPPVKLGGAYTGSVPVYVVRVQIPVLGFDQPLRAAAVPACPAGFDGMACFRLLNRFTYGNFGNPSEFGPEKLFQEPAQKPGFSEETGFLKEFLKHRDVTTRPPAQR